jgi:ribosome-associated toxin RatA of RatAB toxin-antitoxin module
MKLPEMSREPVHRTHVIPRATPSQVYEVVVDFEAYPRLFPELKAARILSSSPRPSTTPSVVRVEFKAQVVIAVRYVLDLTCRSAGEEGGPSVDWRFVEGEVVSDSSGAWRFAAEGDSTRVDYRASMDVNAPLPGFLLRKISDLLLAAAIPNMFSSLEREVRRREGAGQGGAGG